MRLQISIGHDHSRISMVDSPDHQSAHTSPRLVMISNTT